MPVPPDEVTFKVRDLLMIIFGGGGLSAFGAWLLNYLRHRDDRDEHRSASRFTREQSIIGQYLKIIETKDHDYDQDRAAWKAERDAMATEMSEYRRRLQRDLVDMEGMRLRIETQEKDLASLGVSELRQFIGERYDPVIFSDIDGNICWVNEPASLFLRIPIQDLLYMNVECMIPKSMLAAHRRGIARLKNRPVPDRGKVSERLLRGRTLISDGSEIPTDVSLVVFSVGGVIMCRAQIRRRYDRPDNAEQPAVPVYFPVNAASDARVVIPPESAPPLVVTPPLKPMTPPAPDVAPEPPPKPV